MKDSCLDIGVIQAFLDGELAQDQLAGVSGHIANCNDCALMLADAEDESAIVFAALEREFDTLVPTQRLWNKINASIETERQSRPIWQKAWALVVFAFANPSLAAAASLLIVVGVFTAVWVNQKAIPAEVTVAETSLTAVPLIVNTRVVPPLQNGTGDTFAKSDNPTVITVEHAAYRTENRRGSGSKIVNKAPVSSTVNSGFLPGEESYTKTISSLTKAVEEQKAGGIMRPSERIAYERDMAVVNDAIAKMRQEVKRSPKNDAAKQVLYSSYQNKIDLLNSVAQKEELVASLN